jgi:hypothetical protein
MSEHFKPYSPEEALNEAELMRKKMTENNKLDYASAGYEIDLEKVIESAKNGELASAIKKLDLSTDDGVKKIAELLEPWSGDMHNKIILDVDGKKIFKTNTDVGKFENQACSILSAIENSIKKLPGTDLFTKVVLYSNAIYNSSYQLQNLSSSEDGLTSLDASDKFISSLGVMAKFTATALNGGQASYFATIWKEGIKNKRFTNDFVMQHPNYKIIIDLSVKADKFFLSLSKIFIKYLSNLIQDGDFKISGENSSITMEQLAEDSYLARTLQRRDLWKLCEQESSTPKTSKEFAEELEMFTEKIEQYQKVLDEFNEKLSYAKPQTKSK